ncbi:TnsA endonuclease N-terminal domain-containing protein [Gilvimarinus xylanilyticus]|uniref:TnsA endonuclease N-terminal domain-containing protein n=1 Tax=Gilvimarinus xylanilyticus TaxID=2944139 RepID=A0A9X2KU24_9GAMM|nr:TnsA endonuclease N-terminal domain-containing protein [Gilvimarinus xylanilyticus]MCP8899909.1 TnsA endonuclease N-terminal domain-containing protein [Gilvimarinus xylanilyticus]
MAKKLRGVSVERQQKWYKNHVESFIRESYEPYFLVQDIPSSGIKVKTRYFSDSNRIVHLLSMNEMFAYQMISWNPDIVECYEQFAIPIEESVAIAIELGVKHPLHSDTQVPAIQTIDFVCIHKDGEMSAIAVKEHSALDNFRTQEKLAIQEAYCQLNDIKFTILDSSTLKSQQCENLERLSRHATLDKEQELFFDDWLSNFVGILSDDRHERVANVLKKSADMMGFEYARAANLFYHAIWTTRLSFEWTKPLVLEAAASDLKLFPAHD